MTYRFRKLPEAGYTLVELVLYISALAALLTTLSTFFIISNDARIKGQTITEVNQQGEAAMQYIALAVRNASSITAPAAGATASSLTVAHSNASLNPTVISVTGGRLQTKEGAAANVDITGSLLNVSNLSVKNLSRSGTKGTLQISFTIDRTVTSGRNPYTYQKTFTNTASLR